MGGLGVCNLVKWRELFSWHIIKHTGFLGLQGGYREFFHDNAKR